MPTIRIDVAPSLLSWARKSAGLDEETAARRVGVSSDALRRWEAGEGPSPTLAQLRKAGKAYKRPLAVFLLPEPPNEVGFDALRDFRTTRAAGAEPSPALTAEVRRAHHQRDALLELREVSADSLGEVRPLPDLTNIDVEQAGTMLRVFLSVSSADQRGNAAPNDALKLWISALENVGILVIQTHGVEPAEMHGFSISELPYPVIALNGADRPRRRVFTALHELGHIALNLGGICDLEDRAERASGSANQSRDVELQCNQIAAAVLLPRETLLEDVLVRVRAVDYGWPLGDLNALSRKFGVSSEACLLRLVSLGRATWDTYAARKPELEEAYEAARLDERRRNREAQGGPSYYVVKARDIGHAYAISVIDAYRNDRLSPLDVADYLGIRFSQLPALESAI